MDKCLIAACMCAATALAHAGGARSGTLVPDAPTDVSPRLIGISGAVDSSWASRPDRQVWLLPASTVTADSRAIPVLAAITANLVGCGYRYQFPPQPVGEYGIWLANLDGDEWRPTERLSVVSVVAGMIDISLDLVRSDVLRVGASREFKSVAAAAAAANDGALIEIDPGEYVDDVVVWRRDFLTVRSSKGRAHIRAQRQIDYADSDDLRNGKGIWLVRGQGVRIENVEISGARVPDRNGAAIRGEGDDLTVCGVFVHDNENGFLGIANGTLTIENSEFANNGVGEAGRTHNVYVGLAGTAPARLVFRGNYSRDSTAGHLLKSRAHVNEILANYFESSDSAAVSYEIDLPNGGTNTLVGNCLRQGAAPANTTLVSVGAEGLSQATSHGLIFAYNTLINAAHTGVFLQVRGVMHSTDVSNNMLVGPGKPLAMDNPVSGRGNLVVPTGPRTAHIDQDCRPRRGFVGYGKSITADDSFAVSEQFAYPAGRKPRSAADIGAYAAE